MRRIFLHVGVISLLCVSIVISQTGVLNKLSFEIEEGLQNGTFIADIKAESNRASKNYFFQIMGKYESVMKLVVLEPETGILRTKIVIDHEQVCQFGKVCKEVFEVAASFGGNVEYIEITLIIKDVNDMTPTFDPDHITKEISETMGTGYGILLTPAADLDTGENNSLISYRFSPLSTPNDNFKLDISQDNGKDKVLTIKLVKELNYENLTSYELLVLAEDAGKPRRTGTLTVSIEVLDENDNKPVFAASVLNITVTEDITVGKVIDVLSATDKDSGDNGKVEYRLAERQTEDILKSFAINGTTGELSVAKKLTFEAGKSDKVIYIVASDMGTPPQSSQATVYLSILDAGNNPPKIFMTYLKTKLEENKILVSENASLNDAVVHVNVDDTDTGDNGNVTCLTYDTYFGIKEVHVPRPPTGQGFKVFIQHRLDYERFHQHNITVTCVDGGDLTSSVTFQVVIKDVNDNHPKFTESIYRKQMEENNDVGAEVLTVSATDKDSGDNARISYSIDADHQTEFRIDAVTGVIYAKVRLDGDDNDERVIKVHARDHGDPSKSTDASVILTLLDVNDLAPEFNEVTYNFKVEENSSTGTYVDKVTVFDRDKGENKRITCYLLPQYQTGGALEVPFVVMDDGLIYTNTELDRETKSLYKFEVGAHDHGVPSLSSTVEVFVKVTDVNDQQPYFVFPSAQNNSITAFNEVNAEIAQIQGQDNDTGINQEMIYFIVNGNEEGIFYLNSDTGQLSIHKRVHLTEDQIYHLYLSVYDKGDPPRFSKEYLHVKLLYSNVTAEATRSENNNTYVTIVVTLVCITVALSVFIIIVICIIRRKDLHKCGRDDGQKWKLPFGQGKTSKANGVAGQSLPTDKVYPAVNQKNKKEVSFDIDDDTFTDYAMGEPHKHMVPGRPTPLEHMPEESLDHHQPIGILHPGQAFGQSPAKFMAPQDGQLIVGHHREDSHSETSGETTTSHDSGKGGSVEGDTHDASFKFEALNPSAYIIKDGQQRNSYRPNPPLPVKTAHPKHSTLPTHKVIDSSHRHTMPHSDSSNLGAKNQNRTRNWCRTIDSSNSYPDSDYVSTLGSPRNNYSHVSMNYQDPRFTWGSHNNNNSKLSQIGHINPAYGTNPYPTFRSNSTRDDDEASTTTSGSYTINPEDLDDDVAAAAAARYPISHVV